jgi:hypothetical protein
LIFVAMLSSSPQAARLAHNNHASVALAVAPAACALPHDNAACTRSAG